jgi:hypothetical protein
MKCSEAMKRMRAATFGELEAGAAKELEEHLRGCAECRLEQAALAEAAKALKALTLLERSPERQEAAAGAMAREWERVQERRWERPRRRWARAAGAAAVAALAAGALLAWPRAGLELVATRVGGRAQVVRAGTGGALRPGDAVRSGDRVVTEAGAVVHFEVDGGLVHADQDSAFAVGPGRRLMVDRGRVCVDLPSVCAGLLVADTAGNAVEVTQGRVEVGMRNLYGLVGGDVVERPAPVADAAVKLEDVPFEQAAAEVARRSGREISAANPETAQGKVTFYGRAAGGAELYDEFVRAMERQHVAITRGVARAFIPAARMDVSRRLFARVESGEALLRGSHQQRLRATAGQEGRFDLGGTPETAALPAGGFAAWREAGYYEQIVRNRVQLGAALQLAVAGRDAEGRPLIRCRVEDSECLVRFDDVEGTLKLLDEEIDAVAADGGEIVIPLRVRFEVKK